MLLRKVATALLFRCFAFSAIASTMSACLPIPHFQREAPAIEGIINRHSNSAQNVEVRLAVNQQFNAACDGAKQKTFTDANGEFRIAETRQFEPFMVYGDRLDSWSLCFKFADGAKVIWSDSNWWGGPPLQRLKCEFGEELKPSAKLLRIDAQDNTHSVCSLETVQGS